METPTQECQYLQMTFQQQEMQKRLERESEMAGKMEARKKFENSAKKTKLNVVRIGKVEVDQIYEKVQQGTMLV